MSQNINLTSGISTIGNATSGDVVISTLDTTNVNSIKTLSDGLWSSWSPGAPDAFQGFLNILRGKGYVINCSGAFSATFPDSDLDVNNITYETGLDMIAIPFDGRALGSGYVPKLKLESIKTIDSTWKSWVTGAPEELQGFTVVDKNKGYVVNIGSVYSDSYLNNNVQNKSEGVRFNTNDTNLLNGEVFNGVRYTNPNNLGSLSFDAVNFDPTVPTVIMFLSIDGVIAKIEFPQELTGASFFIPSNGSTYVGVFSENEDYNNPTVISSTVSGASLEISYTPIAVNLTTASFLEMTVSYDGLESVLEFASEYTGETFTIWKDGKIGIGTFAEGTVSVSLT